MNEKVKKAVEDEIKPDDLPENPSEEEFLKNLKNPHAAKKTSKTESKDTKQEEKPEQDIGAELEQLKNEIAAKSEEIRRLEDQYMRSLAEQQNQRKRLERETDDARKYAVTSFARDLITVLENLNLAQSSVPENQVKANETLNHFFEGVKLTANELQSVFKKHGIERIDPIGLKFDHNFHQAVMEIPDKTKEPGTIVQVMQAGFLIKDRLLRPAMVAVAKAPPKEG